MRAMQGTRSLAFLIGAVVLLAASSAMAGGYSVAVMGGAGLPLNDFKTDTKTGWDIGGTADHAMGPMWGLGVDLGYHAFKATDAANQKAAAVAIGVGAPVGTTFDMKTTAFQYGAHVTLSPPMLGPIHPYAQAGGAAYSLKAASGTTAPGYGDVTKTKFGWNVGAGVDFAAIPTISLGVAAQYHDIPAKADFGSDFTMFSVQAKATYHIPLVK